MREFTVPIVGAERAATQYPIASILRAGGVDGDDVAGVLAIVAVADFAATDRDPFAGPAASIHATRNVGTWVAGRRVFA